MVNDDEDEESELIENILDDTNKNNSDINESVTSETSIDA